MYYLKMYINKIFIAKYPVEFTGMSTLDERQVHLELLATNMYWEHYQKIAFCKTQPVFFVDQIQSKMNELSFQETEQFGEYIPG